MKLALICTCALTLIGLLAGCTPPANPPAQPSATTPPAHGPAGPPARGETGSTERSEMLVSTRWLAENLADRNVVILAIGRPTTRGDSPDADRATYNSGHIPGARFVRWAAIAQASEDGVPNQLPPLERLIALARSLSIREASRVILYDDQGGLYAVRAYFVFDYLGLGSQTAILDGHWKKWAAEKRPVSLVSPPPGTPSQLAVRPRPEVLLTLSGMTQLVDAKAHNDIPVAVIDARPASQFCGAEAGEGIARAGHIPGAVNVFWLRNIVSEENPVLRPVAELRAIYRAAGAEPGSLVITHCRTGVQAAEAYFVAKYLGYDVRLFGGSYWEWSHAKGTAVESTGPTSRPGH
jgi:thiosulfate/3-mercaptopyruvate sulfurtransferase